MSEFRKYRRTTVAEMRSWQPGERLSALVSISDEDRKAGSPKAGDMIARNPEDHGDQWLVANACAAANFEAIAGEAGETEPARFHFATDGDGHNYLVPDTDCAAFEQWRGQDAASPEFDPDGHPGRRIDGVGAWSFVDPRDTGGAA